MKKTLVVGCAVLLFLSFTLSAFSQVEPPSTLTLLSGYNLKYLPNDREGSQFLKSINSENLSKDIAYDQTPVNKMGDGIINTATSWTDVPREVANVSAEQNIFLGFTLGLGAGLAKGIMRTASGAVDIATFAAPNYDKPLMKTEYKVDNPNDGFKVSLLQW